MQPQSPEHLFLPLQTCAGLCTYRVSSSPPSLRVLQVILQQSSHMFSPQSLKYFSHFVPTFLSLHINSFTRSLALFADFQRTVYSGACPHMQVLLQLSDVSVFLSGKRITCRQESHLFSLPLYSLPYQSYTLLK